MGLRLRVDAQGQVTGVEVTSSSGAAEVDSSVKLAAAQCRFTPAVLAGGKPFTRTEVPDDYPLQVTWRPASVMVGPHRCLRPDYPHAARRMDEEGRVTVMFRRLPGSDEVEARLVDGNNHLRTLRPLTLRAVTECLVHREARESLEPGQWTSVVYDWRLEPAGR